MAPPLFNVVKSVVKIFNARARVESVVHNADIHGGTNLNWRSVVMSYTHQDDMPNRIVVKVATQLKVRLQVLRKQTLLCCFRGGPGGVWIVEKLNGDGHEIQCRSAIPTETGMFEWEVSPPTSTGEEDNMVVRNLSAAMPIEMSLTTPLQFECRLTVFSMFDVNTVAQMFRADARLELMLPNISRTNVKREHVEQFLRAMGIQQADVVQFLNIVEIIDEVSMSAEYVENAHQSETLMDYRLCYRIRAIFTGQFALQAFPFDQQELTIPIQLHLSKERASLWVNYHNPSIFQVTNFQLSNVFRVATGNYVVANTCFSDINESTTAKIYPRVNFSIILQRQGGYYITHIVIPVTIITYMGFLSFCLNNEGKPMDTGERVLISVTMVLTAVTYKFVVAGSIPQISYMTMLDYYVTFSFVYVCCISIVNAFVLWEEEHQVMDPMTIMMIMASVYTAYNICWLIYFIMWIRQRDQKNEAMLNYHRVRLMVTKTFPSTKGGYQGRMFAEMMRDLGIKEAPINNKSARHNEPKISILHPRHNTIKKLHDTIRTRSGPQLSQLNENS
ncbi:unnamed protein product [Aphanomyces euteiches]